MCKDCITFRGVCDCCRLLDNDTSIKNVTYCKICDASLCNKHKNNWIARFEAAYKTAIANLTNKITSKKKTSKSTIPETVQAEQVADKTDVQQVVDTEESQNTGSETNNIAE